MRDETSLMRVPTLLAARFDSSASLRTSSATTANPRPASPARAASMAAFSARRLVWSAIWVMVVTKLPIWVTALPNCCMASSARVWDAATWPISPVMASMASPPDLATAAMAEASSPAVTAAWAPAWAPAETSSMPALASSMAAAESWVRSLTRDVMEATSRMAARDSSTAALMPSAFSSTSREESRMAATVRPWAAIMSLRERTRFRISRRDDDRGIRRERSPAATPSMCWAMRATGREMLPASQSDRATTSSTMTPMTTNSTVRSSLTAPRNSSFGEESPTPHPVAATGSKTAMRSTPWKW